MKTTFDYKGHTIILEERRVVRVEGTSTSFDWYVESYGSRIASGSAQAKADAARLAHQACDERLSKPYRFEINLCDDGSVVTEDGECIGTWTADENDHLFFTPFTSKVPLFFEVSKAALCQKIKDWHVAGA